MYVITAIAASVDCVRHPSTFLVDVARSNAIALFRRVAVALVGLPVGSITVITEIRTKRALLPSAA